MPVLRVGSLCTGYGGIELALEQVFGETELVFVAENDPDASKILAEHFPGIPNYGDISVVGWKDAGIEIDLLTAGFPCTDVSLAGGRQGLIKGNRSGLWHEIVRAIDGLSPPLVFIENVPGLLSAKTDSPVVTCPWCMGNGQGMYLLRAAGAVCGDLATRGYHTELTSVRASEVGAPHRRERVFLLAAQNSYRPARGQRGQPAPG